MQKLISFIMPSRRLDNVEGFLDNIEQTTADLTCVEVLVKFDDDQPGVTEFIEAQIKKRPFTIKYIITPRLEGIYSVWVAMEQLFFQTDPDTYFIQILSDEPRFQTPHWDKVLRNYIGFFKDDVFRLRLSSMKFANYPSHYECTFRPDSFPIYTRRWLELTEGTGNCWGSDAYQQCVAYQLSLGVGSYMNVYRENALCRDVVVYDIDLYGLEFGVGVSREEKIERHKRNLREWNRLTTYVMQEHFSYLARRMNCYIWAHEQGIKNFQLRKRENRRTVAIFNDEGRFLTEMSYAVPRFVVYAQNFSRNCVIIPRHLILQFLSFCKRILIKVGAISAARKGALSLSKLPFLSTKLRNSLFRFGSVKKIASDKPGVLLRRRVKQAVMNSFLVVFLPVYFITKFIDRFFMRSPPGVSVLGRKPDIPRRLTKPTQNQVAWLKKELNTQSHRRAELKHKIFSEQYVVQATTHLDMEKS